MKNAIRVVTKALRRLSDLPLSFQRIGLQGPHRHRQHAHAHGPVQEGGREKPGRIAYRPIRLPHGSPRSPTERRAKIGHGFLNRAASISDSSCVRSPISAMATLLSDTRKASIGTLLAERRRNNGEPTPLGSGEVQPLVSPCQKAPCATAKIAEYVDARPDERFGRLLPKGRGVFTGLGEGRQRSSASVDASAECRSPAGRIDKCKESGDAKAGAASGAEGGLKTDADRLRVSTGSIRTRRTYGNASTALIPINGRAESIIASNRG